MNALFPTQPPASRPPSRDLHANHEVPGQARDGKARI